MRPSTLRFLPPALALLAVAAICGACRPDPQAAILELRSRHTVETRSWQVREAHPLAGAGAAGAALSGRSLETDALAAAIDGEDPADLPVEPSAPAGPRRVEAAFEVRMVRRGEESLPGITLEVSQADPFGQVKQVYRHYLPLPEAPAGQVQDLAFSLLADGFVDGDVFAVVLASEVAPEERGAYRELR